jgi:GINS complex subunit 4
MEFTADSFSLTDTDIEVDDDVTLLTQAWINEHHAPDILPYKTRLISTIRSKISGQQEWIEARMDDARPEERFTTMLYQTELERVKYTIRAYLRTRIGKIERCHSYILSRPDVLARLSPSEAIYTRQYKALTTTLYVQGVLSDVPPQLQVLPDNAVMEPHVDQLVFCRVKEDVGEYQLGTVHLEDDGRILMQPSNVFALSYKSIRALVDNGDVDLLYLVYSHGQCLSTTVMDAL